MRDQLIELLMVARQLKNECRYDDAIKTLVEARIYVSPDSVELMAEIHSRLVHLYLKIGDFESAEIAASAALNSQRQLDCTTADNLPLKRLVTLATYFNSYAFVLEKRGRFKEAINKLENGLAIFIDIYGEDYSYVVQLKTWLSRLCESAKGSLF